MAKKIYYCKKIHGPVKIDGKLNKSAWKKIKPITDFEFPWAKPWDLRQKTECRLCYDDNYLYVGFLAHDVDVRFLKREYRKNVCQDDTVEIFINPCPKDINYYGFEVNAGGYILDYKSAFYRRYFPDWRAKGFKAKTFIKQGKYFACEMAIPFAALGRFPEKGELWKSGIYRIDYNIIKGVRTAEYQVWKVSGNKTPDFHREKSFGEIVFQ